MININSPSNVASEISTALALNLEFKSLLKEFDYYPLVMLVDSTTFIIEFCDMKTTKTMFSLKNIVSDDAEIPYVTTLFSMGHCNLFSSSYISLDDIKMYLDYLIDPCIEIIDLTIRKLYG